MLKKYLKEIGAEGVREDEVCRGNFAEELNHLKALLDKELANNSEEESSGQGWEGVENTRVWEGMRGVPQTTTTENRCFDTILSFY